MRKVELGDVLQILDNKHKWAIGCLMVADGLYPWGVSGYILKPFLAHAAPTKVYVSISWEQMHVVGPSMIKGCVTKGMP